MKKILTTLLWLAVLLLPNWVGAGAITNPASPFVTPTTVVWVDDFNMHSISSGLIGDLGWFASNVGAAPTVARVAASANHFGVYRLTTTTTQGQGGAFTLSAAASTSPMVGLGSTANWDSYLIFALGQITTIRGRVGFANDFTVFPPTVWMGLRYDTSSPEVYSDGTLGTFKFVCTTTDVQKTIAAAGVPGVSRATNIVTVTTTAAHGFTTGDSVTIAGVTDSAFNGQFFIQSTPTTTTFTYNQTAGDATSGSGTATAAVSTVVNSNVAADTSFHTLRIRSLVAGTILMSLDGGVEQTLSSNCPTAQIGPMFEVVTDSNPGAVSMDVDYFQFRMTVSR